MKAIAQNRYGGPDVLAMTDVPEPVPGPDELVVDVRAAAVNAADWHIMRGEPRLARLDFSTFGLRAPRQRVRGSDFAGVVRAVGAAVTGFAVGDEVFGEGSGSFAEQVVAKAEATAAKPPEIGFEEAATLPMAGTTALLLLRSGGVESGRTVLVNGASGGVGTFAVQIARARGAHVTAVCSTRNVEQARSLGAHEVVDYTREDFAVSGRTYDAVVDLVGNRSLRELRRATAPEGTVVLSGGGVAGEARWVGPLGLMSRGALGNRLGRGRTAIPLAKANTADLEELASLVVSGAVKPAVERTFDITAAADAVRHLETEHARGKLVLRAAW